MRLNLARAFAPLAEALKKTGVAPSQPGLTPEQTWQAIRSDSRWRDWQEGRLTSHEWHEHITRRLGVHIGYADFVAAWNCALDPNPMFPDEVYAKLAERSHLGLISNTDPLHVACLEQQFSFIRYFPVRIFSCRVGVCKPAPGIFHAALDELRVHPKDALYVDDVPEFVRAARQLGIDGIHFESPKQFAGEMARRGAPIGNSQ